jgi:hypothetical protein
MQVKRSLFFGVYLIYLQLLKFSELKLLPDLRSGFLSWWLYAGGPTRSHPEHGR